MPQMVNLELLHLWPSLLPAAAGATCKRVHGGGHMQSVTQSTTMPVVHACTLMVQAKHVYAAAPPPPPPPPPTTTTTTTTTATRTTHCMVVCTAASQLRASMVPHYGTT